MKAIVQRVSEASVSIEEKVVGAISYGLVVLAAAHRDDTEANAKKLADRIWGLRIFNDEERRMNLSFATVFSEMESSKANVLPGILCISNFTVYGETAKNRRPSFVESAPFEQGEKLFNCLIEELQKLCPNVQTGVFGADMQVSLVNDGPVTVIVEG